MPAKGEAAGLQARPSPVLGGKTCDRLCDKLGFGELSTKYQKGLIF